MTTVYKIVLSPMNYTNLGNPITKYATKEKAVAAIKKSCEDNSIGYELSENENVFKKINGETICTIEKC